MAAKENEHTEKVLWINLCAGTDLSKEFGCLEGRWYDDILLKTGGSTQLLQGYYFLVCVLVPQEIQQFRFSSETYKEYNQYITAMVGCLWTSNAFQKDTHPQGLCMDGELLNKTGVKEFKTSFNIVYHPAMIGYAVQFLQQVMVKANVWAFGSTGCCFDSFSRDMA